MTLSVKTGQSWKGRTAKITVANPAKRDRRIRECVSARAFHLFESRGSTPGKELEDWRRAEEQVMLTPLHGIMALNGRILVTTHVSCFDQGEIEILVEPHRLTVCGADPKMAAQTSVAPEARPVFRVVRLPVEINPSDAVVRFNHGMLEISLAKASGTQAGHVASRAA
jgi:HSP20 family molecular chaperone IbpA